ncbi:hypothetical protein A3Q56_03238 [Intoshia linei]|uniref:Thioredoxin domain-containing protein n=1 Tax=Intoshia linei TaxID=1819745 RepID=A0A177B621_9BILA|nr:hypothetical protein A3Q56_03238 [Intoshia linei]
MFEVRDAYDLKEMTSFFKEFSYTKRRIFFYFVSSYDDKLQRMWCPDCIKSDSVILKHLDMKCLQFDGLIKLHIKRDNWNDENNKLVYKNLKFPFTKLPTLHKLEINPDGKSKVNYD